MAKVRLLELRNTYKWGGGPDKTILLSAEKHNRERVEVVVAYIRDATDNEFLIAKKARARGLTFYDIEEYGKLDLHVLQTLASIVIQHDINLIHSHDYKSDLFAYLLKWKLRKRRLAIISTLHGWAMQGVRDYVYWFLDLFLMRRFNHLFAVSHATKKELVAAGMPSDQISVIHNAIDTEIWSRHQVKTSMREALGLKTAFPIIGYVGRISPEKDLETWLRTAAVVAKEYPAARFVVVGEGRDESLLNQLKSLTNVLGIVDNVDFLGYREDLPSIYTAFDLFFLSSRREGICNSLLEAMAMEVPIVATDVGGTKELMINGQTGFLLSPGDVEGMAQALISFVRNEALQRNMRQAGRKHIEDNFSFSSRLQKIETLYERVVGIGLDHQTRRPLLLPTN